MKLGTVIAGALATAWLVILTAAQLNMQSEIRRLESRVEWLDSERAKHARILEVQSRNIQGASFIASTALAQAAVDRGETLPPDVVASLKEQEAAVRAAAGGAP